MTAEIPFAILIAGAVLVGLYLANQFLDYGTPQYLSRKAGHGAGGMGYLICAYVFSTAWWPIILSSGFTILLATARLLKGPTAFRGVARATTPAEIWFPLSSTIVLIVGWGIFNQPIASVGCILMMAWGDLVTGICRSKIYGKAVKGLWGSLAMFLTCLIISWCFIHPFWVGGLVAIGATVAEWTCGDVSRIKWLRPIDDNLAIPIVAMGIVLAFT